jgi:glycosyltransferase involved in cell wall biosynthesis
MKILHLLYESDGDYFGIGGVGMRAYQIYQRLRERHDITLLCRKYPGAFDGYKKDLRHIHVGEETENFTRTLLSYAREARRYVLGHGEEYDLIVEEFSPAIPTFLNTYRKRPLILQVQAYTGIQYFGKYNPFYSVSLCLMELVRPYFYSRLVFVSEATMRRYRLRGNADVRIIPNGVEPGEIRRSNGGERYMLYLGRLDIHHKGLDLLVRGFEHLVRNSRYEGRLVIAGDGRDREKLIELIGRLSPEIRERLELAGWVEGERKHELIVNADFLVMPSRYESQPIVALEAAAAGRPVIASDIKELRFIGENRMGINFRAGDIRDLAERIRLLAENNSIREDFGRNARLWAEGYSWDSIAVRFEEYLEDTVRKG